MPVLTAQVRGGCPLVSAGRWRSSHRGAGPLLHFRSPGTWVASGFALARGAVVCAPGRGSSMQRFVHPPGPFSRSGAAMGSRRDRTRSLSGDHSACLSRQNRALAPWGAAVPAPPLPNPQSCPERAELGQDSGPMPVSGASRAGVSWTRVHAPSSPPSQAGCGAWPSSPIFSHPLPGSLLLVNSETGGLR